MKGAGWVGKIRAFPSIGENIRISGKPNSYYLFPPRFKFYIQVTGRKNHGTGRDIDNISGNRLERG